MTEGFAENPRGCATLAWREVETLIATRISANYDRAVEILVDLRELAERSGRPEEARTRTEEIRLRHTKKSLLMTLFSKNKLG
ncbi:hypothetical protein P12x_002624 [Tundrisphaera lichenicola]|uniref:hypothetical protein n=1 Tax=Tundrisphaera lichenicola TaxID=2029860 RepID=UPI003EBD6C1A